MTNVKSSVHDTLDIIPGRHVLVPIATAESTSEIIDMAFTLMNPDEGHVTVLGNPPTGTEDAASNYAQIAKDVQQYSNDGYPIRLRTKVAGGKTRSILDAVCEWGIDVLLLPMVSAGDVGGLSARNIAENIVVTTPCSVIMYRPSEAGRINQIIVPVLQETEEPLAEDFRTFLHDRLDKPVDLLRYQTAYSQDTNPDEALLAVAVSGRGPGKAGRR